MVLRTQKTDFIFFSACDDASVCVCVCARCPKSVYVWMPFVCATFGVYARHLCVPNVLSYLVSIRICMQFFLLRACMRVGRVLPWCARQISIRALSLELWDLLKEDTTTTTTKNLKWEGAQVAADTIDNDRSTHKRTHGPIGTSMRAWIHDKNWTMNIQRMPIYSFFINIVGTHAFSKYVCASERASEDIACRDVRLLNTLVSGGRTHEHRRTPNNK